MDFLDRLKDYIDGLQYTPSNTKIGLYSEDGNDIAINPSPSSIDDRYLSKDKVYPFSFQILVHHKNNFTAYQIIQELFSDLDNLVDIYSENNSFILLDIKCTTTPNFVEETSHGVLYTAIFEAELYIKRSE